MRCELLLGASLSVAGSGLARFLDVLAQFSASRPLRDVCGVMYVLHGIQVVLQQRLGGLIVARARHGDVGTELDESRQGRQGAAVAIRALQMNGGRSEL